MAVDERDYRDDYPLSEAIADVHAEGLAAGESWSMSRISTDERDYATARANRLEARVRELERQVELLIAAAVERELRIGPLEARVRLLGG